MDQDHDEDKAKELSFRPVTKGLGFHPFSDGLPYASPNQKPTPKPVFKSGTGAVTAGAFRFAQAEALQEARQPVLSKKIAPAPLLPAQEAPLPTPTPKPAHQVKKLAADAQSMSYTLKRVASYCLDVMINSLVLCSIFAATFWFYGLDLRVLADAGVLWVGGVFLLSVNWFLIALQEVVFRTSMGKYFFKMVIPAGRIRIFFRAVFFLFSIGLFGAGLIGALLNRRKSCLHDFLLNAQPIDVAGS